MTVELHAGQHWMHPVHPDSLERSADEYNPAVARRPAVDRNEAIRADLDLPAYEPPQLADGTYTHEVVPGLEEQHGCTVRFVGVNTTYPEAWELRVDGRPVAEIPRRRDGNGNTVYGLSSAELREAVRSAVGEA